jgi:hypothetical protein
MVVSSEAATAQAAFFGPRRPRRRNVLEVKVQQETMMICHPTTKGLAQFLG